MRRALQQGCERESALEQEGYKIKLRCKDGMNRFGTLRGLPGISGLSICAVPYAERGSLAGGGICPTHKI